MRKKTITRRMRLSGLSKSSLNKIYKEMKGVSDESTLVTNSVEQKKWCKAVGKVL